MTTPSFPPSLPPSPLPEPSAEPSPDPTDNRQVKVLVIEDNPFDVILVRKLLATSTVTEFAIECMETLATGIARAEHEAFDVVLLDLMLPDSQGIETLVEAARRLPDMPIVVLTGLESVEVGLKAVRVGAQDYLIKGNFDAHSLIRALLYAKERAAHLRTNHELSALSQEMRNFGLTITDFRDEVRALREEIRGIQQSAVKAKR